MWFTKKDEVKQSDGVYVFDLMKSYDDNPFYKRYGGCEAFHRLVAEGKLSAWDEIPSESGNSLLTVYDMVSPRFLKAVKGD